MSTNGSQLVIFLTEHSKFNRTFEKFLLTSSLRYRFQTKFSKTDKFIAMNSAPTKYSNIHCCYRIDVIVSLIYSKWSLDRSFIHYLNYSARIDCGAIFSYFHVPEHFKISCPRSYWMAIEPWTVGTQITVLVLPHRSSRTRIYPCSTQTPVNMQR